MPKTETPAERCFACGRKLGKRHALVTTEDGQTAYVGSECRKNIGDQGWQPPMGGPRLFPIQRAD